MRCVPLSHTATCLASAGRLSLCTTADSPSHGTAIGHGASAKARADLACGCERARGLSGPLSHLGSWTQESRVERVPKEHGDGLRRYSGKCLAIVYRWSV